MIQQSTRFAFVYWLAVSTSGAACNSASTASPRAPDEEESVPTTFSGDPAYRADIELICNVDAAIGGEELDPIESQQRREDFLVERVKQPDAIYFLTVFRTKPDLQRADMLAERARQLKLETCPLRDRLRAEKVSSAP